MHGIRRLEESSVLKGSLMYLNGDKLVDNDGCHGETEKPSHRKFLPVGLHHLVVDMCGKDGGEVLKMRYEGPDTSNSKITVPTSALKHSIKAGGLVD